MFIPELREIEDERVRKNIVATIEQCPDDFLSPKNRGRMLAYLERQKEHWKPSEEQMEELWNVISYIEEPNSNFLGVPALLESLYEQLKKL